VTFSLQGKTVLVAGASPGIGAGFSRAGADGRLPLDASSPDAMLFRPHSDASRQVTD
jgi:NAD(P)-dependent dehydrogenase (short-subunit alcohol dehydrogenase family)